MNYAKAQLLVLRPNNSNPICLTMLNLAGKHSKQIWSNAGN